MEATFLDRVEDRWNVLRRSSGCGHIRSVVLRPTISELLIRVQTNEATATVTARQAMQTLDISVHRFKNNQVLSDGPCRSELELDRRLLKLCTELSASPLA